MRRVEVDIQELVLHGFERLDGHLVAASLERALRTHIAQAGDEFGSSRMIERFDAPALRLGAGATPRTIGRGVAKCLHRSVRS